ncbi:MAG: cytochrome P460 family protein [Desulfobulbaceae bacterium]|nr:cytochrome P460 family protein [Candidatus Kapabacteria bacterium]MBS3999500.1 cytochrome P460 family protein [Desulfobulbaceae bacterium]
MYKFIKLSLAIIFASFIMVSCSDDDDKSPTDFNAKDSDFQNFRTWTLVAEKKGADPALGMAHGGNDENVKRKIYIKQNVSVGSNGEYPIGTIIVKEALKGDGSTLAITAMTKRVKSFNTDHKGWEWFMLADNGAVAKDANGGDMRGANLMDGMCNGCHASASSKDYVFTK